jgi:hypothetical protein
MKRKIFYVLVILVFGTIGTNLLDGVPQEEWDADNFGKVIGQIVDPETGNPVNSKFQVCIFNWNYRGDDYEDKMDCNFSTDEKGYIAINLPPGTYGLLFWPGEPDSKYSMTFHPFYEKMPEKYKERFSCPIKVEKGKITKFFKKAIIGGTIKVTLVDLAGNPVDPDIAFPDRSIKINGYFKNYNLGPGSPSFNFSLKNGQFAQNGFFPDISWEMKLEFLGIGYGRITKKNILVKTNEVTEINVAIDPDDITGIEGKILDEVGNPKKSVRISFFQRDQSIEGYFACLTDSSGDYRMTGMPEGYYKIRIFDGNKYYFMYQNIIIEIKKNILLKKDFIIPPSE